MSGMDGARASARRNAIYKIQYQCPCGKLVYGNGKAHQRSCSTHLAKIGWPLDEGMEKALRDEYGRESLRIIRFVQLALGAVYQGRRLAGDKTEMRWIEYRDMVWQLAETARSRA